MQKGNTRFKPLLGFHDPDYKRKKEQGAQVSEKGAMKNTNRVKREQGANN